ncbi:RNA polymerase sigma factor [Mycolicibacterium sp. HK-90]|uniref:RNA polymerase sigma factor n=1 Tax=Mycolicibacterium sp. HK-90 TaxID=3056937 RepID=UPI0026589F84|nr:RNA polymerase sigma factor [Mycolicibacterium sp. HK-90]WKG03335.1 RNA polymerase sigma factor [Mycolicibacterium sp. HK-90]
MTAVLNWNSLDPSDSDADLARASIRGDMKAFAAIYDRYADRLHAFCVGLLADRDGAADCVQDVFCIAVTQLPQLRDPGKLRPWLYSIARNEALRRVRDRRRETPSDELPDTMCGNPGPDTLAARLELADLIADAAGGLSDRDRAVLELAFRHGLSGPDLADVLGVTLTNANTIVHRLRDTIERALGALLVSRRVRTNGGCAELSTILSGWDGQFNVLMRKRISRHIESCPKCDDERRRMVSPASLLGAAPIFIPAPAWLRDQTLSRIQLTSSTGSMADGRGHTAGSGADRSSVLPITAFLVALIAALSAGAYWVKLPTATTIPAPIVVGSTAPSPAALPSIVPPPTQAPSPPRTTPVPPTPTTPESLAPSPVPEPPPPAAPAPPPTLPPLPSLPPLPPLPSWQPWPGADPGRPVTGPSDLSTAAPDSVVPQ